MTLADRLPDNGTDEAVLAQLGERVARTRLRSNVTQRELAAESGVGLATVKRLEAGRAVGTDKLVRVLRALGTVEDLDLVVPRPPPSPLERLERASGERRRARSRATRAAGPSQWTWGDEPAASARRATGPTA